MLDYESLKHDERKFVALTGITPSEFQRLLPAFTRAYARAFPSTTTQAGKPRQRRPGAGRKAVLLRPEDKLLFILVYQKAYPLQQLLGSLFDLSQSRVNRWVHRLLPLLVRAPGLGLSRTNITPHPGGGQTGVGAREHQRAQPPPGAGQRKPAQALDSIRLHSFPQPRPAP